MDLRNHATAISRFWRSVVLLTVLGVGLGVAFTFVAIPKYQTTTTFFVATSLSGNNSALSSDQFAQARVNSYLGVIQSEHFAQVILKDTGLPLATTDISHMISATVDPQTVLITVNVTDPSQARSLVVARSVAKNLDAEIGSLDNRKTNLVTLRVISGPTLSPFPVSPRKKLDVAIGFLLGLGVGIAQALLRHQLDTSFRSREHLAQTTGVPTLSVIHFDRAAKTGPVMIPGGDHSRRAESFRQLRTNLRFADATSLVEIMVVTSAFEGEGKSTTAANLALSFAEAGRRVLLIDGDLRKPKLSRYLDLEGEAGLTSVLIGDASVEDVVQEWGQHGLDVLTSGPIPPNPSELLGSGAMEKLVRHLRSTYDLVIIDTPPLLPVADAAVTAAQADGVLLVVHYGKARIDRVMEALDSLNSVEARVLGTVLNMAPITRSDKRPAYYDKQPPRVSRASAQP